MPLGTAIHNVEITRGKGRQLARAGVALAKLIAKEGIHPLIRGIAMKCVDHPYRRGAGKAKTK
uniref:Large ribosomal subunit protein uL2 C-terminal domain-containing protein n=1 Tax=Oryza meridionalis TaxID=40149 RepID=A0A0E0DBG5_9ORYZ